MVEDTIFIIPILPLILSHIPTTPQRTNGFASEKTNKQKSLGKHGNPCLQAQNFRGKLLNLRSQFISIYHFKPHTRKRQLCTLELEICVQVWVQVGWFQGLFWDVVGIDLKERGVWWLRLIQLYIMTFTTWLKLNHLWCMSWRIPGRNGKSGLN